jgi:Ca-activated chloride channel homolog
MAPSGWRANGTSVYGQVLALKALRKSRRACPAVLLIFACSITASAQFKSVTPPSAQPPVFRPDAPASPPTTFNVKVNLVRLLASVRDRAGAPITNLNRGDFHVFDSGVAQTIAVFERNTSLPLSVAVLVDTSGSTQIDLHYEVESVSRFIPTLLDAGNPQDTFALFSFNWRTSMEVDFTRSQKRAERALHGMHGEGGTSLYDAIYLASDTLSSREGRHVMVIVTDGGDTTSYKRFEDALKEAQEDDVVLYPIVVVPIANDAGRNIGGEHALSTLAASTGGRIFYPEGFDRLDEAFAEVLRELRTQYLIGFYPQGMPEKPKSYHPVKITVNQSALQISARSGYYEP